jgi:GntR family transcriptional regulator
MLHQGTQTIWPGEARVIELDFREKLPIYRQIAERIKQLIATGLLQPGDQLPTVRQLAADLRVNFNTIARAYRTLDKAGVISTQQGRGTYILEPMPPENAIRSRRQALDELAYRYLKQAVQLGFSLQVAQEVLAQMAAEWVHPGRQSPTGG